jgi:hypothetical protein
MSARAASIAHPPREGPPGPEAGPVRPAPAAAGPSQGRAGRFALRAALALAVAAVLAAAAWAVRANVTAEEPPPSRPAGELELGSASLLTPSGWTPERAEVARVPGLRPPVAVFAPAPGLDAHAVVTMAAIDDPSMVAAPLRDLLGPLGRSSRRSLAGLPALSYAPRAVGHGRTAEVTVARTSGGALTVLCIAASAGWVGAAGCADDLARPTARR